MHDLILILYMYAQSWDLMSSEKAQQSETERRRSDMEEGMSGFCIKATTGGEGGGGGGGGGSGGGTKCGRWNPTAEQVKVLTDLFRSGLRTPSTDQIQRISTQLSYYGKIESKNVFYWFQNHKARERQKRRRVSTVVVEDNRCGLTERDHHHHYHHNNNNNNNNNNNKLFHPKHYAEIQHHHHVSEEREREGEIETLQLFPLNAYKEMSEPNEKLKVFRNNDYKENMFSWGMRKENIDHLPLDLRLSFM